MIIESTTQLHTGNTMPVLGLGTWQLTHATAETVAYAVLRGYQMIDTANDYGTQSGIGEGIKQSGIGRDSFYLVTKVEETDDAYRRAQSNLQELNLDYVDLLLIHRPPRHGAGEKIWKGLIKAKKKGLTKDIGVSNYPAELIDKLIEATGETPVVNQIEWSPFGYSNKMKRYCDEKKIVIQAYSPLNHGKRLTDPAFKQIADRYDKSPAQIVLRWNLQFGTVPLPKANHKTHLEENLNIFDFELAEKDMEQLNSFKENYSSLGSLPYL